MPGVRLRVRPAVLQGVHRSRCRGDVPSAARRACSTTGYHAGLPLGRWYPAAGRLPQRRRDREADRRRRSTAWPRDRRSLASDTTVQHANRCEHHRTIMDNNQSTELLFELSHPGRRCHRLPACDVPTADGDAAAGRRSRRRPAAAAGGRRDRPGPPLHQPVDAEHVDRHATSTRSGRAR